MGADASTRARENAPSRPKRWTRRDLLVLVITLWAVTMTAGFGWVLVQPTGPTKAEVWASDTSLLFLIAGDFRHAGWDLGQYLRTYDWNWSHEALAWIATVEGTVDRSADEPGGFPSAGSLGLSSASTCIVERGPGEIVQFLPAYSNATVYQNGTDVNYLSVSGSAYENLSSIISGGLNGGTGDPLVQLGASNVTAVRGFVGTLVALNRAVALSFGLPDLTLCR